MQAPQPDNNNVPGMLSSLAVSVPRVVSCLKGSDATDVPTQALGGLG